MNIVFEQWNPQPTLDEKRECIAALLRQGEAVVDFVKVNGELRSMPCTLSPDLLPPRNLSEAHTTRKENPEVMRVFCTDKQEWRSFRIDSVRSISGPSHVITE